MTKKFRIIVREVGKKEKVRMFSMLLMDETKDIEDILFFIKNYMIAEQEHSKADNNWPIWVVYNKE